MPTNTNTKKVKGKVTKTNVGKSSNNVTMTLKQAETVRAALAKNGKSYKFLDTKINALQA